MAIDPHILNPYEAYDLPFNDLYGIAHDALTGRLVDPIEKIDGQNLTFTVNALGQVRFIGKGCPSWTMERGGLSIDEMTQHFSDKPLVAAAFKGALEALQRAMDANPATFIDACLGGKRCLNSEVVTPDNTNIIRYSRNVVCFHGLLPHDDDAFASLCKALPITTDDWDIISPPVPKHSRYSNDTSEISDINTRLNALSRLYSVTSETTIGDVAERMVADKLREECQSFLGPHHIEAASRRLLYEEAKHLGKKDFRSPDSWSRFKLIDDDRVTFLMEALIPLERVVQYMGACAMECYGFRVADRNSVYAYERQEQVREIRDAFLKGNIDAPANILKRIEVSLMRLNETIFTRNVEGIIFTWKGRRLKLTGAFTPINRLLGYFTYGSARMK